ncbi:hypothetical protein VTL71DRAFT_59 [Oculimacula yallundae]|uniref:Zn(2)-C6 fungal-type domain-containing protein n=1 Tax=Oculimacula yallundae TaxID=86028 RepID=A0ABR4CYY9_9HELO
MALETECLTSRHRATLSCLECHKRKRKCDRGLPCNQCSKTKNKRQCQYQEVQVPQNSVREDDPPVTVHPHQEQEDSSGSENSSQSIGLHPQHVEELLPEVSAETEPGFPNIDNMMVVLGTGTSRDYGTSTVSSLTPRDGLLMNNFLTLFKHRLNTFAEFDNAQPSRMTDDWLTKATSHPATFYSLLYCGATMYADIVKKRYKEICPKSGCLPYKISAIRNINECLTSTITAVTDEMILAVLMLMNFDSAMETLDEYRVHMFGLRRMIEVRGGLDSLGYHGILKNWYQWCDRRAASESLRGTVYFKAITTLPGDIQV